MKPMIDLIDIGERVKTARAEKGYLQRDLAEKARVSRAMIQALENGRMPDIGFMRLQRICSVVGIDFQMTLHQTIKRPTLEDLQVEAEQGQEYDTPSMG